MRLYAVLLGDRAADRRDHVAEIGGAARIDLLYQREALVTVDVDRERDGAAQAQRRVRLRRGRLEILRVQVAAADDDDVLEPAGDVQLPIEREAEDRADRKVLRDRREDRGGHRVEEEVIPRQHVQREPAARVRLPRGDAVLADGVVLQAPERRDRTRQRLLLAVLVGLGELDVRAHRGQQQVEQLGGRIHLAGRPPQLAQLGDQLGVGQRIQGAVIRIARVHGVRRAAP
jgi:hypothetical protein